jgi:hypothetical protein
MDFGVFNNLTFLLPGLRLPGVTPVQRNTTPGRQLRVRTECAA